MDVPNSSVVTEEQRQLAEYVRELLDSLGVPYEVSVQGGLEAWYHVKLGIPERHQLSIEFFIAPDSFQVDANGADLRYGVMDAGDDAVRWLKESQEIVRALLHNELRIRLRRTLFGGRTGAIWVPADAGGRWNGDLLAVLGVGREYRYTEWWRHAPPGAA
jgi:hypothetical protein